MNIKVVEIDCGFNQEKYGCSIGKQSVCLLRLI